MRAMHDAQQLAPPPRITRRGSKHRIAARHHCYDADVSVERARRIRVVEYEYARKILSTH